MSLLRKLRSLGRRPIPAPPEFGAPISPSVEFNAIGDIHGCLEALDRAISLIRASRGADPAILCVGDFVDRGEQSAQVLRRLVDLTTRSDRVTCLMGNHEDMLLKFLDDPEKLGDRWLRYGGLQTLASFGLAPRSSIGGTRDDLESAMGQELISWIRALPTYWITGNVAVTHAGADPALPIGKQPKRNLIWGHRDFLSVPRTDGMWVVHGHTVVDRPFASLGRIAVDTGAYATGRLTVAHVRPGDVSFRTA